MIHIRHEGNEPRQGLNLMFGPHFQFVIFIATWKHRFTFGFGLAGVGSVIERLRFYPVYGHTTLDKEFKAKAEMHGYITKEQCLDRRGVCSRKIEEELNYLRDYKICKDAVYEKEKPGSEMDKVWMADLRRNTNAKA